VAERAQVFTWWSAVLTLCLAGILVAIAVAFPPYPSSVWLNVVTACVSTVSLGLRVRWYGDGR
jgi:hypothetical protein